LTFYNIKRVSNAKSLLTKIMILSKVNESNTKKIKNFKVQSRKNIFKLVSKFRVLKMKNLDFINKKPAKNNKIVNIYFSRTFYLRMKIFHY